MTLSKSRLVMGMALNARMKAGRKAARSAEARNVATAANPASVRCKITLHQVEEIPLVASTAARRTAVTQFVV